VNYTHDHLNAEGADATVETFAIAPFNFKVGLSGRWKLT
jgi:hypothetical protein